MSPALQSSIVSGFGIGSVYALVGLGFSIIVRTTGAFNFAQGQLVAVGSLMTYELQQKAHLPTLPTAVLVVAVLAVAGGVVERVAIWPLSRHRGDDHLAWLMTTLGASVLLTGGAERIWGTLPLPVNNYLPISAITIGSAHLASPYLLAVLGAILIAVGLEVAQRKTLWGKVLRAMGENRRAVGLAGINVTLAGLIAFMVAGAIAGIGGFILAPITYAQSDSGLSLVLIVFAALAIGGFGSHWGALMGGWIVGLAGNIGGTYLGLQYQSLIIFACLTAVLAVRPQGLAGAGSTRLV